MFCRATQVMRGNLIYFGGVAGEPAAEGGRFGICFDGWIEQPGRRGGDLRHLAKATYFRVARADLVPQMGKVRPEFYDPKRPPPASLARFAVRGGGGPAST